jgi:hypothetical protein
MSKFSFVLANNEVSQGVCPEPLAALLAVHGAHVARGGSGRPSLQDRRTNARVVQEHDDVRGTAEEPGVGC